MFYDRRLSKCTGAEKLGSPSLVNETVISEPHEVRLKARISRSALKLVRWPHVLAACLAALRFYVADPSALIASSIVVTIWRLTGSIDAANEPESLKPRILNGVE